MEKKTNNENKANVKTFKVTIVDSEGEILIDTEACCIICTLAAPVEDDDDAVEISAMGLAGCNEDIIHAVCDAEEDNIDDMRKKIPAKAKDMSFIDMLADILGDELHKK